MKFSFVLGIAVFFYFFLRSIYRLTKLVPKLFFVTMARGPLLAVGREPVPICHFVKSPAQRPLQAMRELFPVSQKGPSDKNAHVPSRPGRTRAFIRGRRFRPVCRGMPDGALCRVAAGTSRFRSSCCRCRLPAIG